MSRFLFPRITRCTAGDEAHDPAGGASVRPGNDIPVILADLAVAGNLRVFTNG